MFMYLNVFWLCCTSWKKLCQCNTVSKSFQKKQRRVELKSVGNFVAKTVLVESANQFSLEKLCRTQYSLKYFFWSHVDHQTYGKTLRTQWNSKRLIEVYNEALKKTFVSFVQLLHASCTPNSIAFNYLNEALSQQGSINTNILIALKFSNYGCKRWT